MPDIYIVPDLDNLEDSVELAGKFNAGFEFDDFFAPRVLENPELANSIINRYMSVKLPDKRTLHGAFYDVTIFSEDSEIRRISDMRIRQSIEFAKRMGASKVVFHTNYIPTFISAVYRDNWVQANVEYFGKLCDENSELDILLENMFDLEPEPLCKVAKGLENTSNFGICFDYAHAALSACSPSVWCESIAKYVKHIHINDNDLSEDLHMALGAGDIDYACFRELYLEHLNGTSILLEMNGIEKQKISLDYIKKLLDI